ncbi:MAG: DNA polymerase III subunit gamma/tau [Deltaproteobacteria bacterium]|nr:DNA polymerase III subunit gamma/tau [Deltaproteobacteria bacterium]
MEYLVLARKFRPQKFDDVAGQEPVIRTLANAIGQGRIGHAFLFSGPRGVGKTSVARILAKSLNCEKGPTAEPCNICPNCREITDGTSMDVREIDGASNRGIDEIRELRENVKFAPAASKYKIYIIDEVHMLTREAFNALLKTLEEPPGHVIFIFATTENHKVPATILSRCQCYDFRRISLAQIAENLAVIAAKEGITISEAALSWIAEAGDGSMRDAQSIFDQVISYAGLAISDDDAEDILGLADRKYLYRLSEAVMARNAGACLMILEEAYLAGIDMKHFYSMLLKHFRNLLLVKIAADGGVSFDIAPEQVAKLKDQTHKISRETLRCYLDILLGEADSLRRSQEVRMKIETILVRMAYLEPVLPVGEILATLESLANRLQTNDPPPRNGTVAEPASIRLSEPPHPAAQQESADPPGPRPASEAVKPVHTAKPAPGHDLKSFIKRENPPLGAKIDAAEILGLENGCLTLGFPNGYIFLDSIMEKPQKDELERIAELFYSQKISLAIKTIETPKINGSNRSAKANTLNDIKREAMNSPIFQKVLSQFEGAELVDIKPITDKKQGG